MRMIWVLLSISLFTVVHAYDEEDCDICLQHESRSLWYFDCSALSGGCTVECTYLIVNSTSDYLEESSVELIQQSDNAKCLGNGVRITQIYCQHISLIIQLIVGLCERNLFK